MSKDDIDLLIDWIRDNLAREEDLREVDDETLEERLKAAGISEELIEAVLESRRTGSVDAYPDAVCAEWCKLLIVW